MVNAAAGTVELVEMIRMTIKWWSRFARVAKRNQRQIGIKSLLDPAFPSNSESLSRPARQPSRCTTETVRVVVKNLPEERCEAVLASGDPTPDLEKIITGFHLRRGWGMVGSHRVDEPVIQRDP